MLGFPNIGNSSRECIEDYNPGKLNYRYFKAEPFQEMDPLMSDNDTGSQQHQQINLEKHPIARVPTLAMIEEQSITAALTKVEEQRTKVTDIFPSQETPSEDPPSESSVANCIGEQSSKHAQRKPSRLRTVSESQQNRFQVSN